MERLNPGLKHVGSPKSKKKKKKKKLIFRVKPTPQSGTQSEAITSYPSRWDNQIGRKKERWLWKWQCDKATSLGENSPLRFHPQVFSGQKQSETSDIYQLQCRGARRAVSSIKTWSCAIPRRICSGLCDYQSVSPSSLCTGSCHFLQVSEYLFQDPEANI